MSPFRNSNRRAMALFIAIVISTVIAMFIAGLVSTNRRLFGFTKRTETQVQFSHLANGAVNRLIQHWVADPSFTGDLNFNDGNFSYQLTFDNSLPDFSVNNLNSSGSTVNSDGLPVAPNSADVVVVCRKGNLFSRYRFRLRRGYAALEGVGTNGRMIFEDDVVLDSIASLSSPGSVEARFHANDGTSSGTGVDWNGSGSFSIQGDVTLSSSSGIHSGITSSNPTATRENEPHIPFPALDVASQVAGASSSPPPQSLPSGGCFVSGDRYLSGNQLFSNDITLSDGTLYIDGDLEINGGISGVGAVFVTGDVLIRGGNATVVTNQPAGAALIAEGDVSFEGLDAFTFLNNAAASRPSVQSALNEVRQGLQVMHDVIQVPHSIYHDTSNRPASLTATYNPTAGLGTNAWTGFQKESDFWYAHLHLSQGTIPMFDVGNPPQTGVQDLAIPGPDGSFSRWNDASPLRRLKEALNLEFPGNAQADQVGQALDELAYVFRDGWVGSTWDDLGQPEASWSLGRLSFTIPPTSPITFRPEASTLWPNNRQAYTDVVNDFFNYNDPLDLSWLGKANFQGIILSNGNINLENDAVIIGSVFADGDLQMRQGATLIYNAEYEELVNVATSPIQVYSFEEL